jgi:hypothetical protein
VISVVACVLGSATLTVVPLIERQIVDTVILRHTWPLWPWLALLIALALASFGFSCLRRLPRGGRRSPFGVMGVGRRKPRALSSNPAIGAAHGG